MNIKSPESKVFLQRALHDLERSQEMDLKLDEVSPIATFFWADLSLHKTYALIKTPLLDYFE